MFRRKRSTSQHHHPLSTESTQSAQSAATHAFLKSQPSSSSLSSAAAAAALRSLTPTPVAVENVQTKRMLQRQASVSSQTGIAGGLRPSSKHSLRRANSSGSMSTRTFRDQSPRRPASSSGPTNVAPPLPAIPREYSLRRNQSRRSVSLGSNVWSSLSTKQAREEMVDKDSEVSETGRPRHPQSPGSGSRSPEHPRSGSRNSINFSYPMNSRTNSPTSIPEHPDIASITDSPSSSGVSRQQNSLPQLSSRVPRQRGRGSLPDSPGRSPQSVGTAVAAAQAAVVHKNDESSSPPVTPRSPRHREKPITSQQSPGQISAHVDQRLRSGASITKRPSTVVEDRQAEEYFESVRPEERVDQPSTEEISTDERPIVRTPPIPEKVQEASPSPLVNSPDSNPSTDISRESEPARLRQSTSPGRTTRFSTRLSVFGISGEHLHQPPSRSVSPAKPALKHPRKSSLSPERRARSVLRPGPLLSELSDATSVASDEGARSNARKKAVKVSFDDEAEIVGIAASPPTSPEDISPDLPFGMHKSKSNWFALHGRKTSPLRSIEVDDFDSVLKPRAALPSFGSIRAGRNGAQQPDIIHQELSDNESTASSEFNLEEGPNWSLSNDHAVGGIISHASQDDAFKEGQTNSIAPLIHATDAAWEAHSELQKENIMTDELGARIIQADKAPISPLSDAQPAIHQVLTSNPNLAVPDITVQPATPEMEKERPSLEGYDVPGDFPRPSLDLESVKSNQKKGRRQSYGGVYYEKSDDESSESVYSDAEEELNGGAFGSINAIVDGERDSSHVEDLGERAISGRSNREEEKNPAMPDVPETCQVARVVTPAPDTTSSTVPDSLDSSNEHLPFSSPYPPFPIQPKAQRKSIQPSIVRSSTMPNNIAKQTTSVPVYNIAQALDTTRRGGSLPRSNTLEDESPHLPHDINQRQVKSRPVSWGSIGLKEIDTSLDNELPINGKIEAIPQRPISNGSDSSSSFKRSYRPVRTDSQHTMRRTLRGSQGGTPYFSSSKITPPSLNSKPLPTGSGTSNMRTTLRSGHKHEKPSLFSPNKSPRGKNIKASGTRFTSRFADSDSEPDGVTRRLHRRKKNLSDEDLRPVRGIPRRQGAHDGDSTELEDSSDNERRTAPTLRIPPRRTNRSTPAPPRDPALAAVAKSRGMTEEELEALLSQPRGGRKPSLLHRFSIRKSKSPGEPGKLQLNDSLRKGLFTEPSRLDHIQVREASHGAAIPDSQNATVAMEHPRLLKKASQKSSGGDTWPLRSDRTDSSVEPSTTSQQPLRPQTSDGVVPLAERALTHAGMPNSADLLGEDKSEQDETGYGVSGVVIESSNRKKRFLRIRKAFGLGG